MSDAPHMDNEDLGRVIDHAIRERLSLRIAYQPPAPDRPTNFPNFPPGSSSESPFAFEEGVSIYIVCPQAWVKSNNPDGDGWYFIAWCELYRDHRAFDLAHTRVLKHRDGDDGRAPSQVHGPSIWIDHPPPGFMLAASPYHRPDEVDWKDVAADAMREGRTALAIDTLAREDNVRFWTLIGEIRDGRHGEACQPKDFEPFSDAFMIGILRASLQDAIGVIVELEKRLRGETGDTEQILRWRELLTSMPKPAQMRRADGHKASEQEPKS